MDEIVKLRENLVSMQICAAIPPECKSEINKKLVAAGLAVSGTTNGWELDETVEPVKCSDHDGRWHYICVC